MIRLSSKAIPLIAFAAVAANLPPAFAGSTFVNDLREIYKHSSTAPAPESDRRRLAPDGRIREMEFRGRLMRLSVFESEQEKKKLEQDLSSAEKNFGASSPALIPHLVLIAAVTPEPAARSILERAVTIAETVTSRPASEKSSDEIDAASALSVYHSHKAILEHRRRVMSVRTHGPSSAGDGADRTADSFDERLLRALLKLKLRCEGLNSSSVSALEELCRVAAPQDAVEIARDALNHAQTSGVDHRPGITATLQRVYLHALRRAKQDDAAKELEDQLNAEQQKETAAKRAEAESNLDMSYKRAEVDPVGFATSALMVAHLRLQNNERKAALESYQLALENYQKLSPDEYDHRLSDSLWSFVTQYLKQAVSKKEESDVLYPLAEMEEKKAAASKNQARRRVHFSQVMQYFRNLHRTNDGLAFLNHMLELRIDLRPGDTESISELSSTIASLYQSLGNDEKAEEVIRRSLKIAENTYGPNDPRLLKPLIDLTVLCIKSGKDEESDRLAERVLTVASKPQPDRTRVLFYYLHNVPRHYIDRDRLQQADYFIRKVVAIPPDTRTSIMSYLSSNVESLQRRYTLKQQYTQAEDLLQSVLAALPPSERAIDRLGILLSNAYLEHAAYERDRGHKVESKRLLEKSETTFDKFLPYYESRSSNRTRDVREQRQQLLKQFGFDKSRKNEESSNE